MPTLTETIVKEVPLTEGWTELDRCLEMAQLIVDNKPSVVVEIGVYGGRTLIPQALALKENGAGRIYGIDPWRVDSAVEAEIEANAEWWRRLDLEDYHRKTMAAIWRLDLDRHVSIIRSPSQFVSELFHDGDIGVINIDGNHSELCSCRDVRLWLPKVAPGGFIAFDDTDWPSTQMALSMLDSACDLVKDGGRCRLYRKR